MSVVVLSTGGTIAGRGTTGKVVPMLGGAELVGLLDWPEAPALEVDDFCSVPSWEMADDLAWGLSARVTAQLARADVDGVVVLHGTDTMEESVWLVERTVDSTKPVVFTGAQRSADAADGDGPRNMRDAIALAAAADAHALGAVIVFAGEVHAARDVRKSHTTALAPFTSPGYGPLGHVVDGAPVIRRRLERPPAMPLPSASPPRVDLIRLYAGIDECFVRAALAAGARAIVLEATGVGNGNARVVEAVREAVANGVTVVISSRCDGPVAPVYGNGGGKDLAEAGALFGGDLAGPKLRLLIQIALAAGIDPAKAVRDA